MTAPAAAAPHGHRRRHAPPADGSTASDAPTFGARMADRVAAFGGSWTFIGLFGVLLVGWVVLNTELLGPHGRAFDPYPYVFLNLMLSMVAALQAPVIMMSQNRQAWRDRLAAKRDYAVNERAECEIRDLRARLDALREGQWAELLRLQEAQLQLLERLAAPPGARDAGAS